MKKLSVIALFALMFTGCGMKANLDIDLDNREATVKGSACYTEDEKNSLLSFGKKESDFTHTTVAGVDCYAEDAESKTFNADKAFEEWKLRMGNGFAWMPVPDDESQFFEITMETGEKILFTNGKKKDDKAFFSSEDLPDDEIMYVITDKSVLKNHKVRVRNGKTKKTVKDGSIVNNMVSFMPWSDTAVITHVDCTYNDDTLILVSLSGEAVECTANGKYDVAITTLDNKKTHIAFYIDTEKPVVSIKDNKLKVKDEKKDGYASGIKSIKLNGKKVKNGAKIPKGKYTIKVTDKAGNTTTKKGEL